MDEGHTHSAPADVEDRTFVRIHSLALSLASWTDFVNAYLDLKEKGSLESQRIYILNKR